MSSYLTAASETGDLFLERLTAFQQMWLKSFTTLNRYPLFLEFAQANIEFLEKLLALQKKFAESMYQSEQPRQTRPAAKRKMPGKKRPKSSKAAGKKPLH